MRLFWAEGTARAKPGVIRMVSMYWDQKRPGSWERGPSRRRETGWGHRAER